MSSNSEQLKQRKLLYENPTTPTDLLNAFANDDEWLSRAQICGRVFRRVTPNLIGMIEQLVTQQFLDKSTEPLPNGYKKFWYRRARARVSTKDS